MPEPLKNLYTTKLITNLAQQLKVYWPPFDSVGFVTAVMDDEWQEKELKQRMRQITNCMYAFLPKDYQQATGILMKTSKHFMGFEYMCFPEYAELYGLEQFELSIKLLEYLTQYSSSEFAVRPFIIKYEKKMMQVMETWAESKNEHVRRLATEGCRPRLPWAMALPVFKKDPTAVIKILEKLKDDSSLYVRRSVANNLNDIAKDHPNLVAKIATKWLGKTEERDWLVKHACRTLLKQAHPATMTLFGFAAPDHISINDFECQPTVKMGDQLNFSFKLYSSDEALGKLRIEFAIDFMKNNGKLARKVFKISESDYPKNTKQVEKYFSFKAISTRKYYAGLHQLAILVNGVEVQRKAFLLEH